jgi:hypothetical protein
VGSAKKIPSSIKQLLEIKQELFEKVANDAYELYKEGRFKMLFFGPFFTLKIAREDVDLLAKKHKLSLNQINDVFYAFVHCVHYLLSNEVDQILNMLPANSAKAFQDRMTVISQIVDKDDTIKNSFYLYNLSKIPFFAEIEWEADFKVFHSPQEYLAKLPHVSVGRVRIDLENPVKMPPESIGFVFEISLKDVENMIKSLEDLRKALENLETATIVQQKGE